MSTKDADRSLASAVGRSLAVNTAGAIAVCAVYVGAAWIGAKLLKSTSKQLDALEKND